MRGEKSGFPTEVLRHALKYVIRSSLREIRDLAFRAIITTVVWDRSLRVAFEDYCFRMGVEPGAILHGWNPGDNEDGLHSLMSRCLTEDLFDIKEMVERIENRMDYIVRICQLENVSMTVKLRVPNSCKKSFCQDVLYYAGYVEDSQFYTKDTKLIDVFFRFQVNKYKFAAQSCETDS